MQNYEAILTGGGWNVVPRRIFSPMSKISVIISHEYISRVKNKWFIITTLLAPVGLSLLIVIPVLIAYMTVDSQEGKVAVLDRSGAIGRQMVASDTSRYELAGERTESQLTNEVRGETLHAYIVIPEDVLDSGSITMFTRGGTGFSFGGRIESDIEPHIVKARLDRAGTDTSVISLVEQGFSLRTLKVTDAGLEEDVSEVSAAIGYFAGFFMYMLIFLYGSLVMRGVIEEKANRIVEVIASSVKPFEIMLGKIIGLGLVGLTQIVAWFVLGAAVILVLGSVFGGTVDPAAMQSQAEQLQSMGAMNGAGTLSEGGMMRIGDIALPEIGIGTILLFIFYFLSGFFMYATLFAAVGSAVDQESDAQQLMLPVTMPIILTIMFVAPVVGAPNSTFSVITSLVPLFTPILMSVRVAATDVPWWQISLSVVLSIASFLGAVWFSAKIYRIGILSYGKKPTLKEIIRWVR
jgi:ABC-2 type transport system permease protein